MKTLLLLLALGATGALAGEVTITLPPEPVGFKPGAGMELAQAHCLICHSAEYPLVQPAKDQKFWEGTVKKMREKFGAPIPDESVAPLIAYLTKAYGKP